MTFPVNSNLQCFRTAALSLVNFKYGVTKSYGACECRKALKNVKILRCQWVKTLFAVSFQSFLVDPNSDSKQLSLKRATISAFAALAY